MVECHRPHECNYTMHRLIYDSIDRSITPTCQWTLKLELPRKQNFVICRIQFNHNISYISVFILYSIEFCVTFFKNNFSFKQVFLFMKYFQRCLLNVQIYSVDRVASFSNDQIYTVYQLVRVRISSCRWMKPKQIIKVGTTRVGKKVSRRSSWSQRGLQLRISIKRHFIGTSFEIAGNRAKRSENDRRKAIKE